MKFAFLIHPITSETQALLDLDPHGTLRRRWGTDVLAFCARLRSALHEALDAPEREPHARVVDELTNLFSPTGASAEGRLYEIPMDAAAILDDPSRAMHYMEEAVDLAAAWGARVVGLGSMTGVIGMQGAYLAERGPVAVTTGNSLTVYAAIRNVHHVAAEVGVDLSRETVAVVGIPGSIASAAAALLAPQCRELLLVARRKAPRAAELARQLDAELLLDVPEALKRAGIVFSATSSGHCIDQKLLRPGSIVFDVAVPTDVQGSHAVRDDVLVLTGGLAKLPPTMSLDSTYLWFHHGMIPSCLGETLVLALEDRDECFSLGRNLSLDNIQQIGALAQTHGLDFTQIMSFGHPLEDSVLVRFRKSLERGRRSVAVPDAPGAACDNGPTAPPIAKIAERAQKLHARHINPVLIALGGSSGFVRTFVRGEGTRLWDHTGKEYLDFVSGFGSLNLGHNPPAVVEAIQDALEEKAPGFTQSAVNPYAAALAEELVTLAPKSLEMVFFTNSGSESVEAALKLARAATRRTGLLSCQGSYHGKSLGSLSVTGNRQYQGAFEPLLPDCETVQFGDLESLERALATRRFAAFVVEPLQAEGGMIVPPTNYLREAQAMCRAAGTLLVVDEVQTGLGRTGAMFACEREGVEPDLLTLAKSLGGGLVPAGALLARRDLWMKAYGTMQTFALHTSTFGGGSLACAAGLAALRVLRRGDLIENAETRGRQIVERLTTMCRAYSTLREVRGRGLLIGLEFNPLPPTIAAHWRQVDPSGLTPYMVPNLDEMIGGFAALYVMQNLLQAHGIYTQVTRSNPRVLRIQPPLTITQEEVARFLDALEETCFEIDGWLKSVDGMIAKTGLGQHAASSGTAHAPAAVPGNGQAPAREAAAAGPQPSAAGRQP